MRFAQASAFALFLLAATPVGSVAADQGAMSRRLTSLGCGLQQGRCEGCCRLVPAECEANAAIHEVASGPEAIEKFIAGLQAKGITDHKLEVIDAGGDNKIVFSTANWSVKGKDKEGKPATFSGLSTLVFERQADNSLKLDCTPSTDSEKPFIIGPRRRGCRTARHPGHNRAAYRRSDDATHPLS